MANLTNRVTTDALFNIDYETSENLRKTVYNLCEEYDKLMEEKNKLKGKLNKIQLVIGEVK
jgi:hypothetical protein